MSDTTAFLAGCAITGVATVLLWRGDLGVSQPRTMQPNQPLPNVPELTTPIPVPPSPNLVSDYGRESQLQRDLEEQKSITDDLETRLKKQQTETEELKSQLDEQRANTEKLIAQFQEQRLAVGNSQQVRTADSGDHPNRFQTIVFLAVGAMLLVVTLGASVILVIVIILLVQSQRRQPRTMHVVHPVPQPYAFTEQEVLPPHTRTRRTSQINYYDG